MKKTFNIVNKKCSDAIRHRITIPSDESESEYPFHIYSKNLGTGIKKIFRIDMGCDYRFYYIFVGVREAWVFYYNRGGCFHIIETRYSDRLLYAIGETVRRTREGGILFTPIIDVGGLFLFKGTDQLIYNENEIIALNKYLKSISEEVTDVKEVECYTKNFRRQIEHVDLDWGVDNKNRTLRFIEDSGDRLEIPFNKIDINYRGIVLNDGSTTIRFSTIAEIYKETIVCITIRGSFIKYVYCREPESTHTSELVYDEFDNTFLYTVEDHTAEKIFNKLKSIILADNIESGSQQQ